MKIKKILNNNAVVVSDHGQEKIAIGGGIAYHKKRNDIIKPKDVEKLFVLKENEKLQQLLLRIPEQHFILSEEIIDYAEKELDTKLNEHIFLALTDHLSFAIEREAQGIHLKNKLLQEIKILYKDEFAIGMWAIKHIKTTINVEMPVDEAAFIALHIHTMKIQGGDMKQTVRQTAILRHMVDTITQFLHITINEDDLSYERLITHLRFALTRMNQYNTHSMDDEMLTVIKKKFSHSYQCAIHVQQELLSLHGIELPDEELGYITLHIERLQKNN
ncbi:PRD domain-containing protein [Alkalihalobacillus hemicellulosilyticus]|uniref:Beta-glucoside bgl operon antiterminator n=1 Tax=Halalkalibacter hemicellulosilyticusJCM 9152 TaxID=1236971 RepID=W4QC65_9BACI|nr:PRD domain-containing protein [Halalkalibacter hemicellulosilyticus]GAE29651.1 beta-glucoside bgl operon antiterminator [Halalkalibacter hemicellulosilyticusJCM 9152]